MSLRESLTRHLWLPAHERLQGRPTLSFFKRLDALSRLSAIEQRQASNGKVAALLRHACSHSPWYRDKCAALHLREPFSRETLAVLPILERSDIRAGLDDICSTDRKYQLIRYTTGGSTGAPLVFYTDRRKECWHNATKLWFRSWFGIQPGDRQIDFWGSPIELGKQDRFRVFKDRYLLNETLLSAFDLTTERLNHYAQTILKVRPRLIYGYPTVISRVAQHIRESGSGTVMPRVVICTSEMLFPDQRALISDVFGCPVLNEYGSRDGGIIAHECEHGSLHIASQHVVVRVDRPDDDGIGDLLITNLDGYGFPLINYRIGDRGAVSHEPCSCGRPGTLLSQLAGRTNDFVVGQNGRLIHSLALLYVLREIEGISQFRIHQARDLSLDIQLVAHPPLAKDRLETIRQGLHKVFEFDIPISFTFVDTIAPEKSGKYRRVISDAADL